jgi:peptidyl-prolyl cis-trans isomerase D
MRECPATNAAFLFIDQAVSMLAFFRRILSSWVAVALLGVIMIAFIVSGVGTPGGGLVGGMQEDAVATIDGKPVTISEVQSRVQAALNEQRQQNPTITMPAFINAIGGVNPFVDQFIGTRVLSAWAERHGIVASERLIGADISAIPAFAGPTGQFDQNRMNAVLSQQHMSFAALHTGIADDIVRRLLLTPISTGTNAPAGLVAPYATLLIARREGSAGLVPARIEGLPQPTDAEIAAFYKANVARYSLPQRRIVRYANIGPEAVTIAPPTDAEIAAAYKADADKYAASETRTVSQVVLPDEAKAKAFAAKVSGGMPFDKAATEAGFAPTDISLGNLTRTALTTASSAEVANAAFALKANGTASPIKTGLGWAIVHVDAIKTNPGRSLDQVKPEIVTALTKKKTDEATANLIGAVSDTLNGGASFDDVVKKHKLTAITTPPVIGDGTAPTDPNFKPDATLTALMKVAMDMAPEDKPTVETVGADQHSALVSVPNIVPAAPLPLDQVKPQIVQTMLAQRAADQARKTAQAILAKVKAGQTLAAAFAAAGLPAPQTVAATQVDVSRLGQNVPPVLRVVFRLQPGGTDIAPGPGGGWFVAHLDKIEPGDPKLLPQIVSATRSELAQSLGEEYARQFSNAAKAEVKVKRNDAAQTKLEQQLRGTAPDSGQ